MFILGVLIFVHELGHYTAGRLLKFDIYEFAIGYGPRLLQKKKENMIFSVRAIPFGGFVAFDNAENLNKGEMSFYKKPIWKRIIVILAGPIMNIIVAYLVVVFILSVLGGTNIIPAVDSVTPGSPADTAGLIANDEIIEINGIAVNGDVLILQNEINKSADNGIELRVLRSGQTISISLSPKFNKESQRYMIGITMQQVHVRIPLFSAVKQSFVATGNMIKELISFLGGLITRGEGAGDVVGPVGSIDVISSVAKDSDIYSLLTMVAFISINLGVFNLIPIPPLDGSKLVIYAVEGMRGKPLPLEKESVIQFIGVVLFVGLFIILTYRDLIRIFS